MIIGVCVADNKGEQLFRKDEKFCKRCGKRLQIIETSVDATGKLLVKVLPLE